MIYRCIHAVSLKLTLITHFTQLRSPALPGTRARGKCAPGASVDHERENRPRSAQRSHRPPEGHRDDVSGATSASRGAQSKDIVRKPGILCKVSFSPQSETMPINVMY
jgi:hypothetical protein